MNWTRCRIFLYTYAGLAVPTTLLMILGSAIGGVLPKNETWRDGYEQHGIGGVLAAMMSTTNGFRIFLLVVLSFSLLGNIAATSYSITLNFQMLVPVLYVVPRYLFAVLLTAIIIPVSINASANFFDSLENFIALIGYWTSAFVGILLVEHFVFRHGECGKYDPEIWNKGAKLPLGLAALGAWVMSFALIVPCMGQVWYTGPIAEKTGDIGFEVGCVTSGLLYVPLRALEKRLTGR